MTAHTFKPFLLPGLTMTALVVVILWMAGSFDDKIEPGVLQASKPYSGKALTVQKAAHALYENVPATIHSKQTTQVAARILAPIRAIHVKAGDSVKKGDVLIELDDRNNQAQVAQARENINAIRARLVQAKSHYDRTKNLFARESVTKAQLEKASADYNNLVAQLASARQQLESSQTTLSYSRIIAGFSARVVDRFAEPGDLASPGAKLLTLYDPTALRIDAYIRESLALTLKIGQNLKAEIPATNQTLDVLIEEIVPAAETGARSFLIKAHIEHQGDLLPGMFARIRIPAGSANQLRIPSGYIEQIGQLNRVWVKENNQAIPRYIRIGQEQKEQTLVIAGLNEGDQLILPADLPKK